jgi:hypothetical protein
MHGSVCKDHNGKPRVMVVMVGIDNRFVTSFVDVRTFDASAEFESLVKDGPHVVVLALFLSSADPAFSTQTCVETLPVCNGMQRYATVCNGMQRDEKREGI